MLVAATAAASGVGCWSDVPSTSSPITSPDSEAGRKARAEDERLVKERREQESQGPEAAAPHAGRRLNPIPGSSPYFENKNSHEIGKKHRMGHPGDGGHSEPKGGLRAFPLDHRRARVQPR